MEKRLLCAVFFVFALMAFAVAAQAEDVADSAKSAAAGVMLSAEDADFLIRSVAAEYGDMAYAARVGVISVILNRVVAEEYPDTAAGVISTYRNSDGSLRFNERRLVASEKALRMTHDAYMSVINGADVTGGALNFEFIEQIRQKLDFDFDDHSEDAHAREMNKRCAKYRLAVDGVGFW